jgi:nitroreductase/dihydropteridine reductase
MTSEMNKTIIDALTWRRAVKVFANDKKVSDEDLSTILEAGRLAPSSYGIEAWKFVVVTDPAVRAQLREAAYGQTQVTDASHLIVITRQTDTENIAPELVARTAIAQGKTPADLEGLLKAVEGAIMGRSEGPVRDGWLSAQTYIPLGIMMTAASILNVDNAAMEGFDRAKVDEILGLQARNLASVTFMVLGYRGDDEYSKVPKVRRTIEEVVEHI